MNGLHLLFIAALVTTLSTNASTNSTKKVETIVLQEVIDAALYGKTNTIQKAIDQKFDLNAVDNNKRTPLMFAAFNSQVDVVKLLIEAGADVNAQDSIGTAPLMFAASAPNGTETIQLLIEAGAEINMVDHNEHFTALMWAAAEGRLESVKLLLKHNADATLKDVDGDTAESFAAQAGHTAVVELLKKATAETKEKKEEPTE